MQREEQRDWLPVSAFLGKSEQTFYPNTLYKCLITICHLLCQRIAVVINFIIPPPVWAAAYAQVGEL